MKKQLFFVVSLMLTLVFSSCNKDLTPLNESNFKTTPNPLEVKGGKVDATITGTFPVKYFAKNATVTVTPVLKLSDGTEIKGTPATYQGEKVVGNNTTVAYKAGGTYTMKTSFDYVPAMNKSELFLDFNVVTKKKTYTLPRIHVADGVMSTETLASKTFAATGAEGSVYLNDKFQRVIQEMQEADILFLIQQSNLRTSETKASDIVDLTKKIKKVKETPNKQVSGLEILGYASPDGSLDLNTNLAEKREKVTVDFINKELKKIKSTVKLDSKFTAEDWDGFQKLMESSNIQDKQVILSVLNMYQDSEQREREIKNLSAAFKTIADEILPQLRRSRLKLTVDVTGKSDVEIANLAKTDAAKLTVEELLYAGTIATTVAEKAAVYQKAVELYPSDARSFNNLGAALYQQGNVADAARYFAKGLEIEPKCPNLNYNAGLCALSQGDLAKAEVFFGNAAGTKGNLSNALGTVSLIKGDYVKASTLFGKTATNNAALAQILTGDYNAARNTLAAVANPDALTAYLGAVVGARTNNRDAVFSNLRTAVGLDKSYGAKAKNDIEFAKFFTEETFKSIVG